MINKSNFEIFHRTLEGIRNFLKVRDYIILDGASGDYIDFIVQDDKDALHFIHCIIGSDAFHSEAPVLKRRSEIEDEICNWLYDNDISNCRVVFDIIQTRLIGSERILIRHHTNAWEAWEFNNGL